MSYESASFKEGGADSRDAWRGVARILISHHLLLSGGQKVGVGIEAGGTPALYYGTIRYQKVAKMANDVPICPRLSITR